MLKPRFRALCRPFHRLSTPEIAFCKKKSARGSRAVSILRFGGWCRLKPAKWTTRNHPPNFGSLYSMGNGAGRGLVLLRQHGRVHLAPAPSFASIGPSFHADRGPRRHARRGSRRLDSMGELNSAHQSNPQRPPVNRPLAKNAGRPLGRAPHARGAPSRSYSLAPAPVFSLSHTEAARVEGHLLGSRAAEVRVLVISGHHPGRQPPTFSSRSAVR
jgi:hypothetical protein